MGHVRAGIGGKGQRDGNDVRSDHLPTCCIHLDICIDCMCVGMSLYLAVNLGCTHQILLDVYGLTRTYKDKKKVNRTKLLGKGRVWK